MIICHTEPPDVTLNRLACKNVNIKDWYVRFYKKENLPRRFHYSNNRAIDDIVLDVVPDYYVVKWVPDYYVVKWVSDYYVVKWVSLRFKISNIIVKLNIAELSSETMFSLLRFNIYWFRVFL